MANDISAGTEFLGNFPSATDLVEKSAGRVLQQGSQEVQATAMGHRKNDIRQALCEARVSVEVARDVKLADVPRADAPNNASKAGNIDSPPSSPYRLRLGNFVCKNLSNTSLSIRSLWMRFLSASLADGADPGLVSA